jgi:hypothetical protein
MLEIAELNKSIGEPIFSNTFASESAINKPLIVKAKKNESAGNFMFCPTRDMKIRTMNSPFAL